jgi:predicted CoA-binding protein
MNEASDDEIWDLLERTHRIAVVGLSVNTERPSHSVAKFLQSVGYKIMPVNPKYTGQSILGEPVVARVTDLAGPIDVVQIFRRPVDVPGPVDDAIAAGAGAVWMQLGIRNDEAAAKARAAGLTVIQDRCMGIEFRRLTRSG